MKLLKFKWFLRYLGKDELGYPNWEVRRNIYWIYRLYLKCVNCMKREKGNVIYVPTRLHEADEVGVVKLMDLKKKLKHIVLKDV